MTLRGASLAFCLLLGVVLGGGVRAAAEEAVAGREQAALARLKPDEPEEVLVKTLVLIEEEFFACRTLAVVGDKSVIAKIEPLRNDRVKDVRLDAQGAIAQRRRGDDAPGAGPHVLDGLVGLRLSERSRIQGNGRRGVHPAGRRGVPEGRAVVSIPFSSRRRMYGLP